MLVNNCLTNKLETNCSYLPDYVNEFTYNILAKEQMENNLVSEIILVLIPTGDRKIKNKKRSAKNKKRSAKKKLKILRCLLDSGSTGNVLSSQHVPFSTNTRRANKIWRTDTGRF